MPKMFTRTTPVTTAIVIVLDMKTLSGVEERVQLAGYFKTREDLLKVLKLRDTADKVYTAVKVMDTEEKLFGMSDETFMKYAEELDPKTRKPLDKATPSDNSAVLVNEETPNADAVEETSKADAVEETADGTWTDNSENVPCDKKSK